MNIDAKICDLGERLIELRKHFGKSIYKMSADFGVIYQTLSRYEKNERKPDSEFLKKVIWVTGCNAHWLLTGEGEMFGAEQGGSQTRIEKIKAAFPEINIDETFMTVIDALADPDLTDVLRHEFYVAMKAAYSRFPQLLQKSNKVGKIIDKQTVMVGGKE